MVKRTIAILGKEFEDNYYSKFHTKVTETYKYRGEIKTRETLKMTEQGERIMKALEDAKIFKCPCCGEKKSFLDLETWEDDIEDIINDKVICSSCYEDAMEDNL